MVKSVHDKRLLVITLQWKSNSVPQPPNLEPPPKLCHYEKRKPGSHISPFSCLKELSLSFILFCPRQIAP